MAEDPLRPRGQAEPPPPFSPFDSFQHGRRSEFGRMSARLSVVGWIFAAVAVVVLLCCCGCFGLFLLDSAQKGVNPFLPPVPPKAGNPAKPGANGGGNLTC